MRDFADILNNGHITLDLARESLEKLEIDSEGLDASDRNLLLSIIEKYDGGPVGVDTLAATMSEERDTIEDVIEPYLIYRGGFLKKTPRGRMATAMAYEHLKMSVPPGRLTVSDFLDEDK